MEPVDTPTAECDACGWDNHHRENGNSALRQTILNEQYIVGKSLGHGGFGITYMGFDLALERRVVIKEYFPVGIAFRLGDSVSVRAYKEAEEDYQYGLDRTIRESREIAKVGQIPNVMQVYNIFRENGTVYIVMEYIDGITLANEVREKGKLNWREALHLLYPIMDALERIHEKGLIHRDISPENIIRRKENGEPVLLDFASARQTQEGLTAMLKPGYAPMELYSPNYEQDGRVDEYALCATLYYLVTGIAPVSADLRLFAKKELKRPGEYAEDIPSEVEKVLLKGMELESRNRYISVRELHDAFLKAEQEAAGKRSMDNNTKQFVKQDEHGEQEKKKEKAGAVNKIARRLFVAAVAVACLIGFWLFGKPGHNADAEKGAAESSVTESVAEKEEVEAEKEEIPTPEPAAAGPPTMRSEVEVDNDNRENATVLGSKVLRSEITEVIIGKSLANAPETAWDVSEAGDGSVLAWVNEKSGGKTLTIAGEGGVSAPKNSSGLFEWYVNLQKVDLAGLDTSNMTDMSQMFRFCKKLSSIDMGGFDTSNVTEMAQLFACCKALKNIDLSNFDTSNVVNMSGVFWFCEAVTSIDVDGFDTSNVTDMDNMFIGCKALKSIDLNNFDTSNVTDMNGMFESCESLESIDVSNFDISNVTDMSYMFAHCKKLTNIDVSNFDTSNVTDMSWMFKLCESLTSIDAGSFNTSNVTSMRGMFDCCHKVKRINVSNFDTSKVTDMNSMFSSCESLTSIDVSSFDTSNVTDMDYMFCYCEALTYIDVSNFDTSQANTDDMFQGCDNLYISR